MSNDEKPSENLKEPGKAATLPKVSKAARVRPDATDVLSLDRAALKRRDECGSRTTAPRTRAALGRPAAVDQQPAKPPQKVQPQASRNGEKLRNGTAVKPGAAARGKTAEPGRTKVARSASVASKARTAENDKAGIAVPNGEAMREMGAHLKRLTEEHARLQTEYARVRMFLQDANVKSSSRIASPVPMEPAAADGEAAAASPRVAEAERAGSEDGGEDAREGFRKEVLRLKEELLAAQQQLTSVTEAKLAADQELVQLVLRTEETGQELLSRDGLIEQLSRQVLQLKARANMQKAEHMQKMEEKEEQVEALGRRLKEAENESRETKEFMQEENNSLADALGEAEERFATCQMELGRVQYELGVKEKHCQVLSQVLEQKQIQLQQLQSDLTETQDGAKEMLLKQGSELNECAATVRRIHLMAEGITKRILSDAEALGVEVGHDEAYKKRRSSDGRKLVWAILQAAGEGSNGDHARIEGGVNGSGPQQKSQGGFALSAQMQEVESGITSLGRIQQTVNKFLFALLNEAEVEKTKLEKDLQCERKRLDEMQSELEENVKRRWALEEKHKELQRELSEAKENLRDSHDTLKTMWDKIDEKANWLIENKRLKEELEALRKQNGQLDARIGLLSGELKETIASYESASKLGNCETSIGEYAKKQVSLKEEISSLHRLLVNREEEMHEKCQKHERHQQVVKNNLLKAEEEVRRLDAVLDHVFAVLKSTPGLQDHPVLKKLWDDLDGGSIADAVEV